MLRNLIQLLKDFMVLKHAYKGGIIGEGQVYEKVLIVMERHLE